jgi:hypothetical protein
VASGQAGGHSYDLSFLPAHTLAKPTWAATFRAYIDPALAAGTRQLRVIIEALLPARQWRERPTLGRDDEVKLLLTEVRNLDPVDDPAGLYTLTMQAWLETESTCRLEISLRGPALHRQLAGIRIILQQPGTIQTGTTDATGTARLVLPIADLAQARVLITLPEAVDNSAS